MELHRAVGIVCAVVLLIGIAASAPGPTLFPIAAQSDRVRSREWVQSSVADFAAGQREDVIIADRAGGELCLSPGALRGTYTSPVVDALFPFNAAAPRWDVDVPADTSLQVELRAFTAEGGWSDWLPVEGLPTSQGRHYAEAPLLVSGGRKFQYRATMVAPSRGTSSEVDADALCTGSPILSETAVIYIDATAGPTTDQAKRTSTAGSVVEAGVPQPPIIPRAGWGADESYRYDSEGDLIWPVEFYPARKTVVHHTVTANDYAESEAAGWVRAIYYYHADNLGWGDIGYSYLVDRYGNVYEGRYGGPDVVAGHVYGYNYGSVGIAALGTHGNSPGSVPPAGAALVALADLSAWEASRSYIHPHESAPFWDATPPNLGGHRDYPPYSTSCPGDDLYAALPALRESVWDRIVTYHDRYAVDWLTWEHLSPVVQAQRTYTVPIRVRNTGWLTWPQAGTTNQVRLGYHWLGSNGEPVVQPPADDERTPLAEGVSFGGTHDFEALVTTPITPGVYTLAWDMVHEGIGWFHDANPDSPLLTTTVTATAPLSITGPLVDVFGRPLNQGRVSIPGWLAVDASQGAYAMPLPGPGTYTLTVSAEGYAPLPPAYGVDATQGSTSYPFVLAPLSLIDRVTNGDFESGLAGWATSGISTTQVASATAAHTGLGAALLASTPLSGTAWLSQSVALPMAPLSLTLSFLYSPASAGDNAFLRATVSRPTLAGSAHSGEKTESISYTLSTAVTGWTHFHADLPPGWGSDLTFSLELSQTNSLTPTTVFVDEIHLGTMPYSIYLPSVAKPS